MQHAAAGIRAIPAVAAFDTTDRLAEFGFKVASPLAITAAQMLATNLVQEAVQSIDDQLGSLVGIGQNPYREQLELGGRLLRHAAPVELFADGAVAERVERAFCEPAGLPRPDVRTLCTKVLGDLAKHLKAHGYDVAAAERHDDGTLSRIAVIDPVYLADASKQSFSRADDGLAAALASLESAPVADAKMPSGIRSVRGANTAAEIQRFVNDFAEQAVVTVRDHLHGMVAAKLPPFKDTKGHYFHGPYSFVVDRERVRPQNSGYAMPQSAQVHLENVAKLMKRVEEQFEGRASFETDAFCLYLAEAVGLRLRSHPELRGALVGRYHGPFASDKADLALVALCGPQLEKSVPLSTRLWRALTPWRTKAVAALPAPTALSLPSPSSAPLATPSFALPRDVEK